MQAGRAPAKEKMFKDVKVLVKVLVLVLMNLRVKKLIGKNLVYGHAASLYIVMLQFRQGKPK